jgi:hypothetical protein
MRVPAILLALTMAVPAMAADRAPVGGAIAPDAHCPRTSSYLADKGAFHRGPPLAPKKLTELPPAIGYMAVYRRIGGCETPLTMVEYRRPQRR